MDQQSLAVDVCKIPEWVPDHLRRKLSGQRVNFRLGPVPRLAARRPVKIPVSTWAEKNRVVTEGNNTGDWKNDIAPHTVKIMDTFGLPWVNEVWFCKVEQSGGTNTLINCMLWGIDCDPGDVFLLLSTKDASDKVVGKKIKPVLRQSRRVKDLVSPAADDTTLTKIALRNGVTILSAWANSPSSMATFSAKYAFGSEVDKYPEMAGKEADPITLIRKRGRTYRGKVKRLFESTCGDGGFIYKNTMSCHQVWRFDVRCPDCGAYVVMDAEHLVIPEGATENNIDILGADYACNDCGSLWDEYKHKIAIRSGHWVCINGEDNKRPRRVGFHHRAWECLDVPLFEIAKKYLEAQAGDLAAKIAWANGYEAVDYQPETKDRQEDNIQRLCDPALPAGSVPANTCAITIAIDTQMHHFWYTVRAWQYGETLDSVLIRYGTAVSFAALEQIIYHSTYTDANGNPHHIAAGFIDSGGGKEDGAEHSRTWEVYDWCKQQTIISPTKGQQRQARPIMHGNLEYMPGTNRAIPGGLTLYNVNTTFFKDELDRRLQINPTDPGAWRLHADVGTDYASHMCSEYRDEKGLWQKGKTRNDLWDCEVLQLAIAYQLDIKYWQKPTQTQQETAHAAPKQSQQHSRPRRW